MSRVPARTGSVSMSYRMGGSGIGGDLAALDRIDAAAEHALLDAAFQDRGHHLNEFA